MPTIQELDARLEQEAPTQYKLMHLMYSLDTVDVFRFIETSLCVLLSDNSFTPDIREEILTEMFERVLSILNKCNFVSVKCISCHRTVRVIEKDKDLLHTCLVCSGSVKEHTKESI